jgi:hypothetical protein
MHRSLLIAIACAAAAFTAPASGQTDDPIATLVARLELEKYKATIKGLTQFGDRRQGTDRNRAAVDWIDARLKSYGCPTAFITNTRRRHPMGADAAARDEAGTRRRAEAGCAAFARGRASTPIR